MSGKRFAVSYNAFNRAILTVLAMGPSLSWVDVGDDDIDVRMGWAFRSRIPRSSITSVQADDDRVWGWGVHGWGGRWLVNGSSSGIVRIELDPTVPSKVVGPFGVSLRTLRISVDDRDALIAALGGVTDA
ncbi:MAG: hypothetical protein KDB37_06695 [Ilumatobacter sp.]|nr:hypothetical protein [Ilumatobacter sp.]